MPPKQEDGKKPPKKTKKQIQEELEKQVRENERLPALVTQAITG